MLVQALRPLQHCNKYHLADDNFEFLISVMQARFRWAGNLRHMVLSMSDQIDCISHRSLMEVDSSTRVVDGFFLPTPKFK
jgi:hypothetical protein